MKRDIFQELLDGVNEMKKAYDANMGVSGREESLSVDPDDYSENSSHDPDDKDDDPFNYKQADKAQTTKSLEREMEKARVDEGLSPEQKVEQRAKRNITGKYRATLSTGRLTPGVPYRRDQGVEKPLTSKTPGQSLRSDTPQLATMRARSNLKRLRKLPKPSLPKSTSNEDEMLDFNAFFADYVNKDNDPFNYKQDDKAQTTKSLEAGIEKAQANPQPAKLDKRRMGGFESHSPEETGVAKPLYRRSAQTSHFAARPPGTSGKTPQGRVKTSKPVVTSSAQTGHGAGISEGHSERREMPGWQAKEASKKDLSQLKRMPKPKIPGPKPGAVKSNTEDTWVDFNDFFADYVNLDKTSNRSSEMSDVRKSDTNLAEQNAGSNKPVDTSGAPRSSVDTYGAVNWTPDQGDQTTCDPTKTGKPSDKAGNSGSNEKVKAGQAPRSSVSAGEKVTRNPYQGAQTAKSTLEMPFIESDTVNLLTMSKGVDQEVASGIEKGQWQLPGSRNLQREQELKRLNAEYGTGDDTAE